MTMGERIKQMIDRYLKTQGSAIGVSSKIDDILKDIVNLIENAFETLAARIDSIVVKGPWLISDNVFLIDHNPKVCNADEVEDYTGHTLEEWTEFINGKEPVDAYLTDESTVLIKASNLSFEDDTFQMGYIHGEDTIGLKFELTEDGQGAAALKISYSGYTPENGGDGENGGEENQ